MDQNKIIFCHIARSYTFLIFYTMQLTIYSVTTDIPHHYDAYMSAL